MTIKSLYPASRPALGIDFAKTKRLDPRVTYTRASTATYVDNGGVIRTAASGVARFDHNPATGESLGLLVEEARTNAFTYSEEFDNAAWTKTNSSITANSATAPNGLQTADTLTSSAAGTSTVFRSFTNQFPPLTFSVYLKANTSTVACIRTLTNADGRNVAYNVNLLAGTISAATGNTGNLTGWTQYVGIENAGNGWYRVFVAFSSSSFGFTCDYEISPSLNRTAAVSGESIFIWGAQLEGGSFPTSYIPTTSATVTRAADVASMTGTNFSSWYNGTEGTLFQNCTRRVPAGVTATNANYGASLVLTSASNVAMGFGHSNNITNLAAFVYTGSTYSASFNFASQFLPNVPNKAALAFKLDSFGASTNGATPLADTSGAVPIPTQLEIGTDNTLNASGKIGAATYARLAFYPVRLPDAQLQALTL
jgi:hypothetical protein